MPISSRALAYFGFAGTMLDVLGGLYMAYDLLGGPLGPLGLVTRGVTYSLIFILGYGIPFGLAFGIIAGVGLGSMLAFEFHRVARHQRLYGSSPLFQSPASGAARGLILGLAAWPRFGARFALLFGALCTTALYVVYRLRFAPTHDYRSHSRPVVTRHRLMAAVWRGAAIGISGALAGLFSMGEGAALAFGFYVGAIVALVSSIVTTFSPIVEWRADQMPERHMVVLGLGLVFAGFLAQALQYLVVILGLPVR